MEHAEKLDPPQPLQPIPDIWLLLHIGVFKSGTTALQATLRRSSGILQSAGVLYRGPNSWALKPLRRLRVAEQLLGLGPNILVVHAKGRSNPSRTFGEAELMHRINDATSSTLSQEHHLSLVKESFNR